LPASLKAGVTIIITAAALFTTRITLRQNSALPSFLNTLPLLYFPRHSFLLPSFVRYSTASS